LFDQTGGVSSTSTIDNTHGKLCTAIKKIKSMVKKTTNLVSNDNKSAIGTAHNYSITKC